MPLDRPRYQYMPLRRAGRCARLLCAAGSSHCSRRPKQCLEYVHTRLSTTTTPRAASTRQRGSGTARYYSMPAGNAFGLPPMCLFVQQRRSTCRIIPGQDYVAYCFSGISVFFSTGSIWYESNASFEISGALKGRGLF